MNKDIKFAGVMFIVGMLAGQISSVLFDLLQGTKFGESLFKPDYSINELIFWMGGVLQDLFFAIALNRLFKGYKYLKLVTIFFIDATLVDICYLIYSNPYELNRSKWQTIEITLLFFILHCCYFKLKKDKHGT